MPDHTSLELLAVLAAGGHLSEAEHAELRAHLATCAQCRHDARVYNAIVSSGLPLARDAGALENGTGTATPLPGARERFLARARGEGAEFSADVVAPPVEQLAVVPNWPLRMAAGLVLAAAAVGTALYIPGAARQQQELDRARQENARLATTLTERDQTLQAQAEQLRQLQTRLDTAGQTGNPSTPGAELPGVQLGQSRSQEARLLEELQNRDKQLAAATEEIDRINRLRVTDRAALDAQSVRLRQAFDQIRIANATIAMERELSTAGRDILDLMAAKQLRVVDVRDTDAAGRPSQAFARIFVSEGRSIRIFAFDLNEGRRFEVWGEQAGAVRTVRSLGVLDVDDRSQNRWSLAIQNAEALRNINSVFVTAAARSGSAPDGPRLLYAFLGPTLARR